MVDQLYGPFRGKFDHIVLVCPTFGFNQTYHCIAEKDPIMSILICQPHEVEMWLKLVSWLFQGTNTLLVLDDSAGSKNVKACTGQLFSLGFLSRDTSA